jgi:ribonuclease III
MPHKFSLIRNLFGGKGRDSNKENDAGNSQPEPNLEQPLANIREFQRRFDIEFSDDQLLQTALKHRSYLNVTNEPRTKSNERLEFLGDTVLDLVVSQFLYEKFPKKTEGELSKVKSILVRKSVLADSATKMSLGNLVLINWGEEKTGGRSRHSILADTFEAVIGAIYLDKGLHVAAQFINTYLLDDFKKIIKTELYKNHKSILLEYTQSSGDGMPFYKVIDEMGPDHAKNFLVEVYINDEKMGEGQGGTKKIAEQEAAKRAIRKLNIKEEVPE